MLGFHPDLIRSAAHILLSTLVTLQICNDHDGKQLIFPHVFLPELEFNLRWLKTVSSTFEVLGFDRGHYNHSLSIDATIMVSKKNAQSLIYTLV